MSQLGFYFNQANCIGCHTCQIACKDKNDLDLGVLFRNVHSYETGTFPTPGRYHYSATCNHCAMPACLAVCPVAAISKDVDTGVVVIDTSICTGCKLCLDACPYKVPQFIDSQQVADKCDFCQDLLEKGENPVCVDSCPMRCLEYGDLDDLKAAHSAEPLTSDLPCLPGSQQTGPSTLIMPRPCALEAAFVETMEI